VPELELDREKNPRAKVPSSEMIVVVAESGLPGRRRLSDDAENGNKQNDQQTREMIMCIGTESIAVTNYGTGFRYGRKEVDELPWTTHSRTLWRSRVSQAIYLAVLFQLFLIYVVLFPLEASGVVGELVKERYFKEV
jgi:hypothetical protein